MIDMMVILVFFLLFTAVFSNTNILELNLPAPNSSVPELPKGLQLEIHVRKNVIEVADRSTGVLKSVPFTTAGYDFKALNDFLSQLKARYQENTEASVLLEQDIPYDVLVQTMDSVRVFEKPGPGVNRVELFPDISVGDAPLTGAAAAGASK
jgi:biopolymer transport protein ExbD